MLHLRSNLHDSTPSTGIRKCCSRCCTKITTPFTMTSESAKSAERHAQITTTILSKQEKIQAEFISALNSFEDQSKLVSEAILENTGSLYDSILVESARADERHEQTTITIVSTQKEAHMDGKQALESMDAASRSEHDILRREFGEVMQAMLKLRQDILR
jgi:hypothetical protein